MNLLDKLKEVKFYNGDKTVKNQISVTEVTGGEVLQAYFARKYPDIKKTKVGQFTLGSIFDYGMRQLVLDSKMGGEMQSGERMNYTLPNGYTLTGEPDILDIESKVIYDVKLTKVYAWKKTVEEGAKHAYAKQLNYYRLLDGRDFKMALFMALKDQNEAKPTDPNAIEIVEVAKIEDGVLIGDAVKISDSLQRLLDGVDKLPEKCNDLWGGNKCKFYCDYNTVCEYAKRSGHTPTLSQAWGL